MSRWIVLLAVCAASASASGCKREARHLSPPPAVEGTRGATLPGYTESAWDVSQGQQLFSAFNCSGCHSQGGGGMGPALMDARWRYGSSPAEVYTSIAHGRPNGMPSFEGRIQPAQIRQLVAYVRALGALVPKDRTSARDEHMSVTPSMSTTARQTPGADEQARP
jgi:cytochrome c oxidase cbb3-type subunit 3